jgi:hypothetical protein
MEAVRNFLPTVAGRELSPVLLLADPSLPEQFKAFSKCELCSAAARWHCSVLNTCEHKQYTLFYFIHLFKQSKLSEFSSSYMMSEKLRLTNGIIFQFSSLFDLFTDIQL